MNYGTDQILPHRLGAVREREGITRRVVASRLGVKVSDVRKQEAGLVDIPLSTLYEWQKALDVPLVELLMDPGDSLSQPALKRAQLIRIMKTVRSILERTNQMMVKRLARSLESDLIEIMPELRDVLSWPSGGQHEPHNGNGQKLPVKGDNNGSK